MSLMMHFNILGVLIEMGIHFDPIRAENPKESYTKQFTFNSKRKSMSTIIPLNGGGYRVLTKGASEIILNKCTQIMTSTGEVRRIKCFLELLNYGQ